MSSSGWWRRYSAVVLCFSGFLSLSPALSYASGFATNFQPTESGWTTGSTLGYCGFDVCSSQHTVGNTDPTPFEETFVVINGVRYIHVLVGDPASGFASESYTRWGPGPNTSDPNLIPDQGGVFSPDGGGNETLVIGAIPSGWNGTEGISYLQNNLNMSNPFAESHISGTGANAPTNTVFRMILMDSVGGMSMEVLKPFLDKKPRISQTIEDGPLSAVFVTDMRALSYDDMSTAAPIVNNLVIDDPGIPGSGAADFEMAQAQATNITSGRFTFTPGTGWNTADGWYATNSTFGQGSYSYIESTGFNPVTFDYTSVFDYAQNAISCNNTATPAAGGRTVREQAGNIINPAPGTGVGDTTCPGHP